jgi:hypothetical protein
VELAERFPLLGSAFSFKEEEKKWVVLSTGVMTPGQKKSSGAAFFQV